MKIKYSEEDLRDHDAIAAVIKNKDGEILVQKHVKYGFWTIPIGKAKQGQSPEDSLKEEVLEECNIKITKFKKLAEKGYVYDRDGKKVKLISHLYEIAEYKGEVKNNEPHKHSTQEFKSISEITNLPYLSDATLLYLENLGIPRKTNKIGAEK